MEEIHKTKKEEKGFSGSPLFFFCRSPNVDIFVEFLAFNEEVNEVAQALDEAVAHLLPPPLIIFCHNRTTHRTLSHT